MNRLGCWKVLVLVGLMAGAVDGCSPKNPPANSSTMDTVKLPGAAEVKAALEKKDYDGAVAAFLKTRETVANEEQHVQFMTLSRELRIKLAEASQTDPKAAEALKTVGTMMSGR